MRSSCFALLYGLTIVAGSSCVDNDDDNDDDGGDEEEIAVEATESDTWLLRCFRIL